LKNNKAIPYPNSIQHNVYIRFMEGTNRADIRAGIAVSIVLKADQRSGKLTDGIVKDILTSSSSHPHGIKVRLQSGEVGRVKSIKE
jgi:uncharacterized repeat protein (TIGR03833 family)